MQMVWRNPEPGIAGLILTRFDLEFTPQSINVLLLVVHPDVLHHVVPDGRVGAIGTDHEIESHLDFRDSFLGLVSVFANFKPGFVCLKICTSELVVEEDCHVGHLLEDVEETFVEAAAVDGED